MELERVGRHKVAAGQHATGVESVEIGSACDTHEILEYEPEFVDRTPAFHFHGLEVQIEVVGVPCIRVADRSRERNALPGIVARHDVQHDARGAAFDDHGDGVREEQRVVPVISAFQRDDHGPRRESGESVHAFRARHCLGDHRSRFWVIVDPALLRRDARGNFRLDVAGGRIPMG